MLVNASMLMTHAKRFSQLDWVLAGPGLKSGLRGTARCFSRGMAVFGAVLCCRFQVALVSCNRMGFNLMVVGEKALHTTEISRRLL